MMSISWGGPPPFHSVCNQQKHSKLSNPVFRFTVVLIFLLITFVMLFNLLIALMTDTYTVIREESEQVWRKDRAMFTDPALV